MRRYGSLNLPLANLPSPTAGDTYWDNGGKRQMVYDGAAWVPSRTVAESTTDPGAALPAGQFWLDTDAESDWSGAAGQVNVQAYRGASAWTVPAAITDVPWDGRYTSDSNVLDWVSGHEVLIKEPGTYLVLTNFNIYINSGTPQTQSGGYIQAYLQVSEAGGAYSTSAEMVDHQSGQWCHHTITTLVTTTLATVAVPTKVKMVMACTHLTAVMYNEGAHRSSMRIVRVSGVKGPKGDPGGVQGVLARTNPVDVTTVTANTWKAHPELLTVNSVAGRLYRTVVRARALGQGANINWKVGTFWGTTPAAAGHIDWYVNANSGTGYASCHCEEFWYGDGAAKTICTAVQLNGVSTAYSLQTYVEDCGPI